MKHQIQVSRLLLITIRLLVNNSTNTVKGNSVTNPSYIGGKGQTTTTTPTVVPKDKTTNSGSTPATNYNTPRNPSENTSTPKNNTNTNSNSNTPRNNNNNNYTPPSNNNNTPRNNYNTPRNNNSNPRNYSTPKKRYNAPRSNMNGTSTPSKSVYKNKPGRTYSTTGNSAINSIKKATVNKSRKSNATNTSSNLSSSQKRR